MQSRRADVTPKPFLDEIELKVRQNLQQPSVSPRKETPVEPQPSIPQPSILRLETTPAGAVVLVDGTEKGVSPISVNLQEGSHQIEFQLEGYDSVSTILTLKAGETQTYRAAMQQRKPEPVAAVPDKTAPAVTTISKPKEKVAEEPVTPLAVNQNTAKQQAPPVQQQRSVAEKQIQAPSSKPVTPQSPIRFGKREAAPLIILGAAVAALLWIRARRKGKAPQPVPQTLVSPTQPRSPTGEEIATLAIGDLYTPKPAPGHTPVSADFKEVKKQSIPLKEGAAADFGAYTLEGMLGRGGMGTTYLARRKRDSLPVAIKVPHDHLLDQPEFAQRFLREGALGSTLHHPNIIRVYEAEKLGNQPYIVMELIEGETLEKLLRRERILSPAVALEISRDIALALDYARLKGVVHRDLKPDNIMMLKRGGLKVMDYGIARTLDSGLTSSEAYLGTPTYSAPESTLGKVDQQSDLYSLGIILFRMLTGDPPFRSIDPLEVLQMHRSAPLPPFPKELDLPDSIFLLVGRLAAKEKSDRYPDAESFLVDLNRVLKTL
jgi:hypothetical protein